MAGVHDLGRFNKEEDAALACDHYRRENNLDLGYINFPNE